MKRKDHFLFLFLKIEQTNDLNIDIIKQYLFKRNMNSFSTTYISSDKKEGKTSGKWINTRRGKTFVTVISDFKPEKKNRKKVTFQNDSENIQKPRATKIAIFSIMKAPNLLHVRTNEEIEKEDMKAALAFLSKKTKKKAWKPSFLRKTSSK